MLIRSSKSILTIKHMLPNTVMVNHDHMILIIKKARVTEFGSEYKSASCPEFNHLWPRPLPACSTPAST